MTANELHQLNQGLIEISMEDVYNPPIATRIFAYSNLAAFGVNSHRKDKSFFGTALLGTPIFTVPGLPCPDAILQPFLPFVKFQKIFEVQ